MKVLSTAGNPMGTFASVRQDGSYLTLEVTYRKYGQTRKEKIELSDEAMHIAVRAIIDAMRLPEFSD